MKYQVIKGAYSDRLRDLPLPTAVEDIEEAFGILIALKAQLGGSVFIQDHMLVLEIPQEGYVVVEVDLVEAEA